MKVLLIDDHALFRDGMVLVLEGLGIDGVEVYEAGSYELAEAVIRDQPDINMVLLDLGLPGISYLDALQAIQQQLPHARIVVLSGTENQQMVESALQCGAQGYIPKSTTSTIMLDALQLVIDGGVYVPAQILQKSIMAGNAGVLVQKNILTSRQNEILKQLSTGKSNKEIGLQLSLKESTVRSHVAAILKAFNVANRTSAVQFAFKNNFL